MQADCNLCGFRFSVGFSSPLFQFHPKNTALYMHPHFLTIAHVKVTTVILILFCLGASRGEIRELNLCRLIASRSAQQHRGRRDCQADLGDQASCQSAHRACLLLCSGVSHANGGGGRGQRLRPGWARWTCYFCNPF